MDNQNYYQQPAPQQPEGKGKAITSMVLGICSICFMCGGPLAIVLGIIAMNFAKKVMEQNMDGQQFAKVGKITGLIGLIAGILGCVFWLIMLIVTIAGVASSFL